MLSRLSGYRTYLALWLPVLGVLGAIVTHHAPPEIGWLSFAALVARAVDQTFMRMGVAKTQTPATAPKTRHKPKQRSIGKWSPLLLILLLQPSCAQQGYVSKQALKPLVTIVARRHDGYVNKDPHLTDAQRERYLRSTRMLRAVVESPED